MGMTARDRAVWDESFIAASDLSAKQHYAMKLTTTATDTCDVSADTDRFLGILQNNPKSGEEATLRLMGMSKAVSDGSGTAIAIGDLVGPSSTGTFVKKATADYGTAGVALDASAGAGLLIGVIVYGPGVFRTLAG